MISKWQVHDFQELGAQSSRIKGSVHRKGWVCFNKRNFSGSLENLSRIVFKAHARVQEPPQRFPWALFAFEKGPCDYFGGLLECIVMQSGCRIPFTLQASERGRAPPCLKPGLLHLAAGHMRTATPWLQM